jgi:hypothetical protein
MLADTAGNVVPFRRPVAYGAPRRDQKGLLDAVYSASSLPVGAGDRETKLMASRLQVFGFVVIDEVTSEGDLRRLRPSETMRAAAGRPWRVSKPSVNNPFAVAIPASDAFLFEPSRPAS